MKRFLALLCAAVLMFSTAIVTASAAEKLVTTNIPKSFPNVKQDPNFTVVQFWHAMGGAGTYLGNICNWYNSTEGKKQKTYVKAVYQGDYDAVTVKLQATIQSGNIKNLPDIVQLSSQGAFSVKESKYIQYMQEMMDADKEYSAKIKPKLDPSAVYFVTYKGKQLGMPFANSVIVLYYNKDAFKAVGIDPASPPKTLADYATYAAKLLIKGKGSSVVRYGGNNRPYVYQFATWIPRQKNGTATQFDMGDGHLGIPTKLACAEDGTLKATLTEWTKALKTGAVNYNSNSNTLMINGQSCMFTGSIAGYEGMLTSIAALKDVSKHFEPGMAPMPAVNATDVMAEAPGGNAIYMFNKGDDVKKQKAWNFIKFLTTPDVSAYWYVMSGYFPMNSDAINTKYVQDVLKKLPEKKIPLNIRAISGKYYTMQEPWMPTQLAYSNVLGDQCVLLGQGKITVDQAVTNITKKANSILDMYHKNNS